MEEEVEDVRTGAWGQCCEMLTSRCDMAITLMNSQLLWLSEKKNLHKVKLAKRPHRCHMP